MLSLLCVKDEFSQNSPYERNVGLSYQKLDSLKNVRKIVIISGSSGSYGTNSKMLSQAFGLPVVNTSTHADIGIRMQFEIYKDFIRKGDIMIFTPEYDNGEGKRRLYGGSTLLRMLSTHVPSAYKKLSLKQCFFLYKFVGVRNMECLKHIGSNKSYSENILNEYGDIDCEREHQDSLKQFNISGKVDEDIIQYYKYVKEYCKEKEIELIFLPPTFMHTCYQMNKAQIDSIDECLRQNGVAYDALPHRYSFPDSLYFDTSYHMTKSGANKRTERIVEDIRRKLRK